MDVQGAAAADLQAQLANGLQEGLRFDVPHRAAGLHDHHIRPLAHQLNAPLDLVGDVRDDLGPCRQGSPRAAPVRITSA